MLICLACNGKIFIIIVMKVIWFLRYENENHLIAHIDDAQKCFCHLVSRLNIINSFISKPAMNSSGHILMRCQIAGPRSSNREMNRVLSTQSSQNHLFKGMVHVDLSHQILLPVCWPLSDYRNKKMTLNWPTSQALINVKTPKSRVIRILGLGFFKTHKL